MERVPTPTFPRVLGKNPGTKVGWEEEIQREVGPKIRGPTGPHERPSPEPSEELGLSFISPIYRRSGGLGLTSPPGPIPNFQICPRLSDAPGTLHTRRPKLHRAISRSARWRPGRAGAPDSWLPLRASRVRPRGSSKRPRLRMCEMAPGATRRARASVAGGIEAMAAPGPHPTSQPNTPPTARLPLAPRQWLCLSLTSSLS